MSSHSSTNVASNHKRGVNESRSLVVKMDDGWRGRAGEIVMR